MLGGIASRLARRLVLCAGIAGFGLVGSAATAHAAATPFSGTIPYDFSGPVGPIDCLGPDPGAISGHGTVTFGGVSSDQTFFHYHEARTEDGVTVFPDGTYVVDHFTSHFDYNSGTHQPVTTLTNPVQDRGTVYDKYGQPTGQVVTFHALEHFTWIDTNHNGDPDPGDDYRASVDNLRLSCR
jgi:hypothetical protein